MNKEENEKLRDAVAAADYHMKDFLFNFECDEECQCCLNNRAYLVELKDWIRNWGPKEALIPSPDGNLEYKK